MKGQTALRCLLPRMINFSLFLCVAQLCTNDSPVPGRNGISERIYEEFRSGTWVANKNATVPFCSIGADHALEQINRSTKVAGGLVGITLNPAALTKFFLNCTRTGSLTRQKRQGGQAPVAYHVTDTTNIAKVEMKRQLSHTKTKSELTAYLAEKLLKKAHQEQKHLVVAWGSECLATHENVVHLGSSHEEADTKLVLHALAASCSGATTVHVCSPDTDVLVLLLRRYAELCQDTSFVTGVGQNHRIIKLGAIYSALGDKKAAALPSFHALSGADVTGSFSGNGKISCWKVFNNASEKTLTGLAALGTSDQPSEDSELAQEAVEQFVCSLYVLTLQTPQSLPNTKINEVGDLRWLFFKQNRALSEKLPLAKAALQQAIFRAHYHAMIWENDNTANPTIPSQVGYGWKKDDESEWQPVTSTLPPASDVVLYLVKCGCQKTRCATATKRCACAKANLPCTDMCRCMDTDELCANTAAH